MRQFQTSVIETRQTVADGFATQPFECAWATEAIFFLHLDESSEAQPTADAHLVAHVQISPDGIRWIDEGTKVADPPSQHGSFARVRHFGGWLRLRFAGDGEMTVTIRLALKE